MAFRQTDRQTKTMTMMKTMDIWAPNKMGSLGLERLSTAPNEQYGAMLTGHFSAFTQVFL